MWTNERRRIPGFDESEPIGWILDVCATCGAKAIWPGCEHWQSSDNWTMAVEVRPTKGSERRLRESMRERRA